MESICATGAPEPARPPAIRKPAVVLVFAMAAVLGFDIGTGALTAAWKEFADSTRAWLSPSLPAVPYKMSDADRESLLLRPAQQQAEMLMQAAINHDEDAIELIEQHLEDWRGQLRNTPRWSDLDLAARYADDLRVREAAIEIDLIAFNLPRNELTANQLHAAAESDPALRAANAFALGMLANRGVEPDQVRTWLLEWAHTGDEPTRFWAVEGLALIGSDATVADLIEIFRTDFSFKVRERAACSLARSGMLSREQRMSAVPGLVQIAESPNADETTRGWAFAALREITEESLPNHAASWRQWYARASSAKLQQIHEASPWDLR